MRPYAAVAATLAVLLLPRPAVGQARKATAGPPVEANVPPPPARDPPPPPAKLPAPPHAGVGWLPRRPTTTAGEWVYTTVLGWIWAPRASAYADQPPQGQPHAFVYLPAGGWQWIVAPWVWGNWWPHPHPPVGGTDGRWAGASMDEWRHRHTPAPADAQDDFDDDGDAFSLNDFQESDFGPTQFDDSDDGFGYLDFGMGNAGPGELLFSDDGD